MKSLILIATALAFMASNASAGLVVTKRSCVLALGTCVKLRGPVFFVNSFPAPRTPPVVESPETPPPPQTPPPSDSPD